MAGRFAVLDLDGTYYRWQLDHALMTELEAAGVIHGFQDALRETYEAWQDRAHPESFRRYASAFDEVTAQYLRTVPVAAVRQAAHAVVRRSGNHVHTYIRQLIADLRAQGYVIIAISGSLRQIVQPFAQHHGFDLWRGQDLGVAGKYFARPYGSFAPEQKGAYLLELCETHDLTFDGSVGVGDTLSDVSMLELVRPICFNPDRQLLHHAMQRGWRVVFERKDVIIELTLQGGRYQLVRDHTREPRHTPAPTSQGRELLHVVTSTSG